MPLQLLDRCQHLVVGFHHRGPQGGVGQGLGAAQGFTQGRGYLVQMVHSQILRHAFQCVGGAERGLPILGGQGVLQLVKAGVAGIL